MGRYVFFAETIGQSPFSKLKFKTSFQVIAPQFKHFQKLRDLVEMRLPPGNYSTLSSRHRSMVRTVACYR